MPEPRLTWDLGTAYDLFVSLHVLHEPATFGVRGVWAAGMRSRLPAAQREFLEEVVGTVMWAPPLHWLSGLLPPKDGATALRALARLPAAERLPALMLPFVAGSGTGDLLQRVLTCGEWRVGDVPALSEAMNADLRRSERPSRRKLETILTWWAQPEAFGERYLKALTAYHEVFFAEEERRILPALQDAFEHAQALAEDLPVGELLEEITAGLSFSDALEADELLLAPSFWSAPLTYYDDIGPGRMILLFGGRPDDASLIPGEMVPEALLRALKALSDPTRLKIMHYLSRESLTPTQLAHRLRLRAPTVVHHLKTLRLAGLVQVRVDHRKERSYAVRRGSVQATCESLHRFMGESLPEPAADAVTEG